MESVGRKTSSRTPYTVGVGGEGSSFHHYHPLIGSSDRYSCYNLRIDFDTCGYR